MSTKTEHELEVAWSQKAGDALDVLNVAAVAPALIKADTVRQAERDLKRASRQLDQLAHLSGQVDTRARWAFWSYL